VAGQQSGSRTGTCLELGGSMDGVVVAMVLALAVLSFVWLRLIEKA
jgi:hypothetical protein